MFPLTSYLPNPGYHLPNSGTTSYVINTCYPLDLITISTYLAHEPILEAHQLLGFYDVIVPVTTHCPVTDMGPYSE